MSACMVEHKVTAGAEVAAATAAATQVHAIQRGELNGAGRDEKGEEGGRGGRRGAGDDDDDYDAGDGRGLSLFLSLARCAYLTWVIPTRTR